MTRTVFRAGLNWRTIEAKWPNFRRAFSNFSPERVARYDGTKVERLLGDEGIVRNRAKILATISNAKEFVAIRKQQGSFDTHMEELRRLPEENRCRILAREFSHLGPSTAVTFLRAVGEEMPEMSQIWMASFGNEPETA
jgi:3-methyladenine DNA glycosylase Tag